MSPGSDPRSRRTRRAGAPVGYRWHLRQVMADRGLFATSDLQPLLTDRGIDLSASQVYRLVTTAPERLNLATLAALCDALQVTPSDLIEPVTGTTAAATGRTTGRTTGGKGRSTGPVSDTTGGPAQAVGSPARPARARITGRGDPGQPGRSPA